MHRLALAVLFEEKYSRFGEDSREAYKVKRIVSGRNRCDGRKCFKILTPLCRQNYFWGGICLKLAQWMNSALLPDLVPWATVELDNMLIQAGHIMDWIGSKQDLSTGNTEKLEVKKENWIKWVHETKIIQRNRVK